MRLPAIIAIALLLAGCAAGALGQQSDLDGGDGDGGGSDSVCGNGIIEPGEQCDDGNAAGGDGCSAQCQFEDCGPEACPQGCCDAQGACVSGTEDRACGTRGTMCLDCTGEGYFCQDQACEALPVCTEGETRSCGNCGFRTCDAQGLWGDCEGEGPCLVGDTELGTDCGNCGYLERTCDSNCDWGDWICSGEGVCTPGEVETGSSCGVGGHEERICHTDCTWLSWTCEGEGECTPGTTETGSGCGNCGHLERTCDSNGVWSSWVCTGEGVCASGTTETGGSCGDCGTEERTCSSSCTWGSWSCTGEGVCSPGSTKTGSVCCQGYPPTIPTVYYTQTCSNSCSWGSSVCEADTSCSVTGHLTCGENNDPCSDPEESWRCVYSSNHGAPVSQVCRGGAWVSFNLFPSNCSACCGSYTSACAQ